MEPAALIEAILFHAGEPVRKDRLGEILDISDAELDEALSSLSGILEGRGITLLAHEGRVTLATAPGARAVIEALAEKEERTLSKGALEVLAIIAYEGPVSGTEIDRIRGVNSQSALRQLLLRGLVKRERASEAASYQYTPSIELLAHLGISSLTELPEHGALTQFLAQNKRDALE